MMGRVSPGMAGGFALISSVSSSRARATRGERGRWRVTVIASGVYVMVPARPRMIVSRVMGKRRDKPAWRRRWKSSAPKG